MKYKLKSGKIGERVVNTHKQVEKKFTGTFLEKDATSPSGYSLKTGKTAERVIHTYHKIEDEVVGAYKKIEDAFVDKFLEKDTSNSNKEN